MAHTVEQYEYDLLNWPIALEDSRMIDSAKMIDKGMWSIPATMSGLDRTMINIGTMRIVEKTIIAEEIIMIIVTGPITIRYRCKGLVIIDSVGLYVALRH